MSRRRTNPWILELGGLCLLLAAAGAAGAQQEVTTYTPSRVQWQTLSYQASRMGVRANSEIRIAVKPAASVSGSLVSPPGGKSVEIDGEQVAEVVIESTVRGRTSVMTLTLDPATAAAYQRTMLSPRKNETLYRIFRYLPDGVFVRRHQGPANAGGAPTSWAVSNERTIAYPEDLSEAHVTEAGALFYMLSAGDFRDVGDRLTFYNFDRDGMSRVVLTVEQMTQFDVDYTEVSPRGERRVRATHPVARLSVSGATVGEGEDAFSFLGLTGDIEIFADPQLRVPVAVRGRVPRAGRTTVQLNRMTID